MTPANGCTECPAPLALTRIQKNGHRRALCGKCFTQQWRTLTAEGWEVQEPHP